MITASHFQLKVALNHIEPLIWRRIVVPSGSSLKELHAIIQGAMGWQDCHLFSFDINSEKFEIPDFDEGLMNGYKDARKVKLISLLKPDMRFSYEYDFGDSWGHSIEVERTVDDNEANDYVICTAGERACPPEDCGGPFGYDEFIEAHQNKTHPDHDRTVEWAPVFEPEVFSLAQANNLIFSLMALNEAQE